MKLLLRCGLLLAVFSVMSAEFLYSECDEDFTRDIYQANHGEDNDIRKVLYCNLFERTLICTERYLKKPASYFQNSTTPNDFQNRTLTEQRVKGLRTMYQATCDSCGGPALVTWLLALPLVARFLPLH